MRILSFNAITKHTATKLSQRGMALILTLLVLTIVIVLTVQFQYSVTLEQRIVQNQASDEQLSLVARGAVLHIMEHFKADDRGEILFNEIELQNVDTHAEPYMDPQNTEARVVSGSAQTADTSSSFGNGGSFGNTGSFGNNGSFDSGTGPSFNISYEVVDLDRRFNLNWLLVENEQFRKHAKDSLKRLVIRLGHPEDFADKLIEFLTGETADGQPTDPNDPNATNNTTNNTNTNTNTTTPTTTTNTATTTLEEGEIPERRWLSINELFNIDHEGTNQALTGKDENGQDVEGIKPLLNFLTVWPTPGLNVNTAPPEILYAWLPNKDKKRPQATTFNARRRIQATKELIVYRLHVEGEENFETETTVQGQEGEGEGETTTETPPETEEETTDPNDPNAEQPGSSFVGTGPIRNFRDFAKPQSLKFIFSQTSGRGPTQTAGANTGTSPGTNTNTNQSTGQTGLPNYQNWHEVLKFRSKLYKLTISVSQGQISKVIEVIVYRGQSDVQATGTATGTGTGTGTDGGTGTTNTTDPQEATEPQASAVLEWRELSE